MSNISFSDGFLFGSIFGVTVSVIFCATSHLIEKNKQQRDLIEELFSRLEKYEKNHESSQDS